MFLTLEMLEKLLNVSNISKHLDAIIHTLFIEFVNILNRKVVCECVLLSRNKEF